MSSDMFPDAAVNYLLERQGKQYISGPMRGRPRYNFDEFYKCEEWLAKQGFDSHNPARIDEEVYGFDPDGTIEEQNFDLNDAMARDIAFIVSSECSGVVVLDGWQASVGARAEVLAAQLTGKPVRHWTGDQMHEISSIKVGTHLLAVA